MHHLQVLNHRYARCIMISLINFIALAASMYQQRFTNTLKTKKTYNYENLIYTYDAGTDVSYCCCH